MAKLYNQKTVSANQASVGQVGATSYAYKGFSSANAVDNFKLYDIDLVKQDIINHFYIRKGEKGLCLIAGDISPIDVITHLPILCEEQDIPYVYVPSKAELGSAAMTKRPTSCVLIKVEKGSSLRDLFKECVKELPKGNF